jgi:5-methylcytosine-specific restriction enzyme subunit McrC
MPDDLPNPLYLDEQAFCPASLFPVDVPYLSALRFQLRPAHGEEPAQDTGEWLVNPGESVGHFRLPSGRIVVITPKIGGANVFRMLAYVFTAGHQDYLRPEQVEYASDSLLFEPLVRLLNELVGNRVRRGLVQDYVGREENLASFRGAFNSNPHIQQNLGRDNLIHCRFFEQTVDVGDNRLIKSTLHHLLQVGGWTTRTTHNLVANFHQFDSVILERPAQHVWGQRHYHRLNNDYRPIHSLCRMFLAYSSISERVGVHEFKGFLLNMNMLFEEFIQQSFVNVARHGTLRVAIQKPEPLSTNMLAPVVRPDVTIRDRVKAVTIVDAKYKKDANGPGNPDIYQVIAYGTVLKCPRAYLLYPHTELDTQHEFPILNSQIVVRTRRVDISASDCVGSAETTAENIIAECQRSDEISLAPLPNYAGRNERASVTNF